MAVYQRSDTEVGSTNPKEDRLMLQMKSFVTAFAVVALLVGGLCAQAADPVASGSEVVKYRLEKWRTTHSEGAKTEKLVATLKKLRCEVKVGSHGGHTDVRYRCPKWQSLALKDHRTAHQWEAWLKKYGFQTQHEH